MPQDTPPSLKDLAVGNITFMMSDSFFRQIEKFAKHDDNYRKFTFEQAEPGSSNGHLGWLYSHDRKYGLELYDKDGDGTPDSASIIQRKSDGRYYYWGGTDPDNTIPLETIEKHAGEHGISLNFDPEIQNNVDFTTYISEFARGNKDLLGPEEKGLLADLYKMAAEGQIPDSTLDELHDLLAELKDANGELDRGDKAALKRFNSSLGPTS